MGAPQYVLLASVFYRRQEDGRRVRYRKGDVIPDLSATEEQELLARKVIGVNNAAADTDASGDPAGVNSDSGAGTGDDGNTANVSSEGESAGSDAGQSDAGQGVAKPPKVATKDVLVQWLVENAQLDPVELAAQEKPDLWALIEATD